MSDGQTILVTGGAGYIGAHACAALAESGFEPVTFDDLSRGVVERVQWGPLEQGCITDCERLSAVVRRYRPVGVLHFAALTSVPDSLLHPVRYTRINVHGTRQLIRATGSAPVVFSSTAAVYTARSEPAAEDAPLGPQNPYGVSKLEAEGELDRWARETGGRWVGLRYFNACGADPKGRIGEYLDRPAHLVPRVLYAAREGAPIDVFGDDWPTRDGTCVRDYVHVSDLAAAHVLALRRLLAGEAPCGTGEIYNLANSMGHTVLDVIASARRVTGRSISFRIAPRRSGDVAALVGNAERARRILRWRPRLVALDDMLATSWTWLRRGSQPAEDSG